MILRLTGNASGRKEDGKSGGGPPRKPSGALRSYGFVLSDGEMAGILVRASSPRLLLIL
jgi:hypothetical protein